MHNPILAPPSDQFVIGLFALAATWLPEQVKPRDVREGRLPICDVLIPMGLIVTITVLHLGRKMGVESFDGVAPVQSIPRPFAVSGGLRRR